MTHPDLPAVLGLLALTLTPPWGTAIMRWRKGWENRDWLFPRDLLGKRIGIHQGDGLHRPDGTLAKNARVRECTETIDALYAAGLFAGLVDGEGRPLTPERALAQVRKDAGLLLGTVQLGQPVRVGESMACPVWDEGADLVELDPYMVPGGYAWPLLEPQHLAHPIPMKGLQKFWKIDKRRLAA